VRVARRRAIFFIFALLFLPFLILPRFDFADDNLLTSSR
jgi:hypothetical protein